MLHRLCYIWYSTIGIDFYQSLFKIFNIAYNHFIGSFKINKSLISINSGNNWISWKLYIVLST